jgi:O-antigen/teichoic acid export membrane protein
MVVAQPPLERCVLFISLGRECSRVSHEVEPGSAPVPSLAARAATGVALVAGSAVAVQVLAFLSGVVVARHVLPAELGAVAIANLIVGLATLVTGFGFGQQIAAGHIRGLEELRASHWLVLAIASGLTLLLLLASHALASLFGDSTVASVLSLSATAILLSAAGVVPGAVMQQQGRFGALANVGIASQLAASTISIGVAVGGHGLWAPVIGGITGVAVRSSVLWRAAGLSLLARMRFSPLRGQLRDCLRLLSVDLGDYGFRNADNAIVARFFGAHAIGLYSFAYILFIRPVNIISGSVGSVLISTLSHVRQDRERLDAAVVRAGVSVARIAFPVFIGGALVAPLAIPWIFGERWIPAVPLVQVFFAFGSVQAVAALVGPIWISLGKSTLLFRWSLAGNAAMVLAFAAGAALGSPLRVALLSGAFSALVLSPLSVWATRRYAGTPLSGLERRLLSAAIDTVLMAASVAVLESVLVRTTSMRVRLLVEVSVGAVVYTALFRLRAPEEFASLKALLPTWRSGVGR